MPNGTSSKEREREIKRSRSLCGRCRTRKIFLKSRFTSSLIKYEIDRATRAAAIMLRWFLKIGARNSPKEFDRRGLKCKDNFLEFIKIIKTHARQ